MERGLILLIAALVAYVAPDVQGTSHLSFSNNTMVNITRDGCGVSKLCLSKPEGCNPNATGNCLFVSVDASAPMAPNGTNLAIELRGYSTGYVALGLTQNASEGTSMLFVCAQNSSNNGSFFFRTRQRNNTNGDLMSIERRVKEIRGEVEGKVIKCEFMIPNANASMRMTDGDSNYTILLGNGTYNATGLGPFVVLLKSALLNLADPAANVGSTSSSGGAVHPHAVLSLMSVLTLCGILRA